MAAEKSEKIVSVVLSGAGGYGYYYLQELLKHRRSNRIVITGIVDPFRERYEYLSPLAKQGIKTYNTMEEFFSVGNSADLAVISSPYVHHYSQCETALKNGSNVLCDKPLCPTVQDLDSLCEIRDSSQKWLMVGFQWCYTTAIQELKHDIMSGRFGAPKLLKTLCFWARDDAYYNRNDWAGRIKYRDGNWILDSPANNAMAHFLHLMLYLIGEETALSATPNSVIAEAYRANPIENYDTVVCRIITENSAEILFYASHACKFDKGPIFHLQFEEADIIFRDESEGIIVRDKRGNVVKTYNSPDAENQFTKLNPAIENCYRSPIIVCGPEAVRAHTICVNGIQESIGNVVTFPASLIIRDEREQRFRVKDLGETLLECYSRDSMPSELNYEWAFQGKKVNLIDYNRFPSS